MMRATLVAITLGLGIGLIPAQDPSRVFSRPTLPTREALDQLNLKLAWRTYAATNGTRDSVKTVHLAGDDVFVHARSGLLTCIDSATGQTRWRVTTGPAFPAVAEMAYNSAMVFGINGTLLTAFDRANGRLLWQSDLPGTSVSTAPLADDPVPAKKEPGHLYISGSNNHLYVYELPYLNVGGGAITQQPPPVPEGRPVPPLGKPLPTPESDLSVMARFPSLYGGTGGQLSTVGPLSSARDASRTVRSGPAPLLIFEHFCDGRLDTPPVMGFDGLLFAGANGNVFTVSRRVGRELFEPFSTDGPIVTPPGVHGDMAYVVGGDKGVYAVKISSPTGRRYWRFTKGAPILHRPAATDDSVYITVERSGLWRLDRETGIEIWGNPDAHRFLASNAKFVYALDVSGRLMVLDRKRGTRLSGYPTRDFNFPVINDSTDRIFLAAHDGMIACLHDKDYRWPMLTRTGDADFGQPGRKITPPGGAPVEVKPGDKPMGPGMPADKPKDGVEVGIR